MNKLEFCKRLSLGLLLFSCSVFAYDKIVVEAPWELGVGRSATLSCETLDANCKTLKKQSKTVSGKSGREFFTYTGSTTRQAESVRCDLAASGIPDHPDAHDSKNVPGKNSQCGTAIGKGKETGGLIMGTEGHTRSTTPSLAGTNKVDTGDFATDPNKRSSNSSRPTGGLAMGAQTGSAPAVHGGGNTVDTGDFATDPFHTSKKKLVADKKPKQKLVVGKKTMSAEEAKQKSQDDKRDRAYAETRTIICTTEAIKKQCEAQDLTCQIGGPCGREDLTLDPNQSPCKLHAECGVEIDGQQMAIYEGQCINNRCVSRKREECQSHEIGKLKSCVSPDGKYVGISRCTKDSEGYTLYGDCDFSSKTSKSTSDLADVNGSRWKGDKNAYNDFWRHAAGTASKSKGLTLDTKGTPCSANYECNTEYYEGLCVAGTCNSKLREKCSGTGVSLCQSKLAPGGFGRGFCNDKGYLECQGGVSTQRKLIKEKQAWEDGNGTEYKKFLSGTLMSEANNKGTVSPDKSPCDNHAQCVNGQYVGQCVNNLCESFKRDSCTRKGDIQACLNKNTQEAGWRICQPKGMPAMNWSRCFSTKTMDSDIQGLKQSKQWNTWDK